jgi:hypothetical protein
MTRGRRGSATRGKKDGSGAEMGVGISGARPRNQARGSDCARAELMRQRDFFFRSMRQRDWRGGRGRERGEQMIPGHSMKWHVRLRLYFPAKFVPL